MSEDSGTETETERGTEVDPDETFRVEEGYSLDPDVGTRGRLTNGVRDMHIDDSINHVDLEHLNLNLERTESAGSSMYASSEADSDYSSIGGMGDSMTFPPIPRNGGARWIERDDISETGSLAGVATLGTGETRRKGVGQVRRDTGWADKPTFFEYLYGA